MRTIRSFWVLAGLAASWAAWGATLTVDDDGAADFSLIQDAIDVAAPGDTVSVAPGTYFENIELKSGVRVVGAGSDVCTIDGGRIASVAILRNCDPATVLEGFTLANGEARRGGGILVEGGAPVISTNRIIGNSAVRSMGSGGAGGGIALLDTHALVLGNQIEGNDAAPNPDFGVGGGVHILRGAPVLRRNRITNNTATSTGGGINIVDSAARIEANTISFNSVSDYGGGIRLLGPASPVISNNLIVGNMGGGFSGGVDVYYSSAVLINNTLADNEAQRGGGALVLARNGNTVSLINNLFFRNSASMSGGGAELWVSETGAVELFNNLFFSNSPTFCQGFVTCDIGACTLDPDDTLCEAGTTMLSDPLLVDPDALNFRLRAGSPAIDSGRLEDAPGNDFRGQRRPLDGNGDAVAAVDRGALEFDRNDVLGLRFVSLNALAWDAEEDASIYHVYSGSLSSLAESGVDMCRDGGDGDRTDLAFIASGTPTPGDGFAYAVTAVIGGSEQSAGFDSRGLERSLPFPCP